MGEIALSAEALPGYASAGMRFAANLSMMFTEIAFMERFAAAAEAGFDAIEFLFPYDFPAPSCAEALRVNGLTQALFNLPAGDWHAGERGLASLDGRRDDFRRSVEVALVYADATGARALHMMAGICPSSDAWAEARYLESLAYAAAMAAPLGITILIEPINPVDMPGYFLNDFGRALSYIETLGAANVRLQYDIYHRQILHGDVLRSLERLLPAIGHVQIASVPQRAEPGTGELDDMRILRRLEELGYDGFIGCEYRPATTTVDGLDWLRRYCADRLGD